MGVEAGLQTAHRRRSEGHGINRAVLWVLQYAGCRTKAEGNLASSVLLA